MAPSLIGVGAQSIVDRARQLGLTWTLRPATVVTFVVATGTATVQFDGDTATLGVVSLIGQVSPNQRVMCMSVPPGGNFIIGSIGSSNRTNDYSQIAFGERLTPSTASAGSQGVLRLDNVPIVSGQNYLVTTNSFLLFNTVIADVGSARLAFSTSGVATTGSSTMAIYNSPAIPGTGNGVGAMLSVQYQATTTGLLSVLLWTVRLGGSGNISIFGNAISPIQLSIFHVNGPVANTGVAI
jgi:hypothetical protein